jgi:hypothetical protein
VPPGAASGGARQSTPPPTGTGMGMGSLGNSGSRSERAGSLAGVVGGGRVGRVASTRVFVFNARSAGELVDPIRGAAGVRAVDAAPCRARATFPV